MTEKLEPPLTPEEVILAAFTYFDSDTLDRESLTRVALMTGCPSEEIAHRVLSNMVRRDMLTFFRQGEDIFYSPKKQDDVI